MEGFAPDKVISAAPARRPGVVLFALAMGSFAIAPPNSPP
jgi:hypothetical protein